MHGTLKSVEGPPNLGINLPLSTKPTNQNSASHNKEDTKSINGTEKLEKKSPSPLKKGEPKKVSSRGWTCWDCDRFFTQRDVYISHMRKEHGKVNECLITRIRLKPKIRSYVIGFLFNAVVLLQVIKLHHYSSSFVRVFHLPLSCWSFFVSCCIVLFEKTQALG